MPTMIANAVLKTVTMPSQTAVIASQAVCRGCTT